MMQESRDHPSNQVVPGARQTGDGVPLTFSPGNGRSPARERRMNQMLRAGVREQA